MSILSNTNQSVFFVYLATTICRLYIKLFLYVCVFLYLYSCSKSNQPSTVAGTHPEYYADSWHPGRIAASVRAHPLLSMPISIARNIFAEPYIRHLSLFYSTWTACRHRTRFSHGAIDYSGIVPSIDRSRALLDRNVEPFQQRAQLPVGRTFVMAQARPHDGRNLLLDIPLGIIHFPQALLVRLFLPLDTRMQIIFPF